MNWQAINFDWNQVRAFLATVEEGSLAGAARVLGVTQPTVGRQVTSLEEALGVTLFERVGRALAPTPAARELAAHVRAMGEAATRFSLAATGQATAIEGTVRITASEIYSAYLLPPIVAKLRGVAPGIKIDIVATNSLSDLRRREAEIAVRNTRPTDPDLIARKLNEDEGALFASHSYCARLGPVRALADLERADFVGFSDNSELIAALNRRGCAVTEANFVGGSANHIVHWALVREGLGIGIAPVSVGEADPHLARILPGEKPFRFPIWLVAPQELNTSRRVRLVFDFLAEHLV